MKRLSHGVGAFALLVFAASALAQADERPALPDQYAEVVLRVEGMT